MSRLSPCPTSIVENSSHPVRPGAPGGIVKAGREAQSHRRRTLVEHREDASAKRLRDDVAQELATRGAPPRVRASKAREEDLEFFRRVEHLQEAKDAIENRVFFVRQKGDQELGDRRLGARMFGGVVVDRDPPEQERDGALERGPRMLEQLGPIDG